jgi:hypothetical protein
MGLFQALHRRAQQRQDEARSAAEAAARADGWSEAEVQEAGRQAAKKKRRRMLTGGYGGAGGVS